MKNKNCVHLCSFCRPHRSITCIHRLDDSVLQTLQTIVQDRDKEKKMPTLICSFFRPHPSITYMDRFRDSAQQVLQISKGKHAILTGDFLSVHCSLVVTCWERASLLALLNNMFSCVFVTFPCGVLGRV